MQQFPEQSVPNQVSGQRLFIGRLLETFFRHRWLYVLPLVPFLALGVATVAGKGPSYRSTGVILVNRDTLLNQLTTNQGGNNPFGFDTPALYTSRQINTLLGTDTFLDSVIAKAGLETALTSGAVTKDSVRRYLWAGDQGDTLVAVNAASPYAEMSYRLAGATIDSYIQWEIDGNLQQSQSSEQFFESLLVPYQQKLDDARGALAEYVSAHPAAGSGTDRPVDEQVEIANLTEAVNRADDQLATARASLSAASLSSAQSSADVSQRLRVVDSPQQPIVPEPHRRKDALTLMFYLALGALVSGAVLVVGTLLDKSVRYSDEIEAHLHVPVLAIVPNSRGAVGTRVL